MKGFDALAGKSLAKTELLGCVWFTHWLHHYPPIGITSEFDRKYSSVSQDWAFFWTGECFNFWLFHKPRASLKLPSSLMVPWCLFSSRLVHHFCRYCPSAVVFSKDPTCSLPVMLPSSCCKLLFPAVTASLAVGNALSQIRHLMANLAQDAQWIPTFSPFPVTAAIAEHSAAENQLMSIWEGGTCWRAWGRLLGTVKATRSLVLLSF